ncbi:hypothetical protein ACHHYP_09932, partial [Achlya hypogyna]
MPSTAAPTKAETSSTTAIFVIVGLVVVVIIVAIALCLRKRGKEPVSEELAFTRSSFTRESPGALYSSASHVYVASAGYFGSGTDGSSATAQSEGSLDMCNLESHRLPATDITLVKTLAQGAYGQVWLGHCHGDVIAVKKLLQHKQDKHALQKFIYEIALMA